MTRQCGAQTRSGEPCRRPPKTGSARCQLHGGRAGRPPGTPMHDNTRAAIAEGRRRWVERMREAKERGEINRFPNGRRAKGLPPLSKDPKIRKAQRFVEKAMAKLVPSDGRPWTEMSKAEKLGRATERALDCVRDILELGIDPSDAKTLAIVKDTALNIISQQIRLDALKELHARGDAAADNGRAEEQRLFDLAFADLQMQRARVIEASTPANGDDEEDRAVDGS